MPRKPQTEGVQAHPTPLRKAEHHPQDVLAQAILAEAQGDWKAAGSYYAQGLEQRSAELTLINSVQEGLSSQLHMSRATVWRCCTAMDWMSLPTCTGANWAWSG